MKLFLLILYAGNLLASDIVKQPPVVFSKQSPACTLVNGRLVLPHAWPIGSWEDCAYGLLSVAIQLDNQSTELRKQLQAKDTPKN